MIAILSILIGLVFVLLLFSMLSSALLELLDALFSLRGRHLRNTLENMLGDDAQDFFHHPIFKQLSYAASNRNRMSDKTLPGWINKETFSAIVIDILGVKDKAALDATIEGMPKGDMRRLLQFLRQQSGDSLEGFQQKIEYWFEEVMQRATDWYRRNTRWWLFFIGIGMAGVFNADTIQIYRGLSANAAARDRLVELAENFAEDRDSIPAMQLGKKTPEQAMQEYVEIKAMYHQIVQSPLGLGWSSIEETNLIWWLLKFAGLLLTGLAVTLGAQFWFDILKNLLSLKSGNVPQKLPTQQPSAPAQENPSAAQQQTPKSAGSVNPDTIPPQASQPVAAANPAAALPAAPPVPVPIHIETETHTAPTFVVVETIFERPEEPVG